MYKLMKNPLTSVIDVVNKQMGNILLSIPFDPANTDYANFKADIIADKATLQNADGNEMSAEQAKEFVSTLP